jgi:hypothetical protein
VDIRLEKRIAPRRNACIAALIVFRGGKGRKDCLIRNVSEGGAKLELFGPVSQVPNTFTLSVTGHRPQACRVVWRTIREIGIQFVDTRSDSRIW